MEDNQSIWSKLGVALVKMAIGIGNVIFSGWVLTILWAWFIMPNFAVGALTVSAAIGLAILRDYFLLLPTWQMGFMAAKWLETNVPGHKSEWATTFISFFLNLAILFAAFMWHLILGFF